MKALILIAAPALFALAAPAAAQSVFDGTWKVDPATAQFGGKPTSRELKGGIYRCLSCAVPWSVPADGAYHPIKGNPYVDSASVKVDGPRQVTMGYRKDGKVVNMMTATVSDDGNTVTSKGTDTGASNGATVTYETQQTRVGTAPAGAHSYSGEWRNAAGATLSDAALTMTMRQTGDMMTMKFGTGEGIAARFGGPAVPVTGDAPGTTAKVVRSGPSSFTTTTMRGGKIILVETTAIAPDGQTLTYTSDNKQNGSTARYTATKQ